jgi:two-component system, sensor histidine kinase
VSDEPRDLRAIEDLRHRVGELEASVGELAHVLDTMPDALVVVAEDGVIALVNQQAEQLFGHDRAALLGKPIESLLPERFRNDHGKHRRHYAGDPHMRPMGAGLELRALHRDGSEIPVEISLSPILLGGRQVFASSIRDISGRVEIEARLREAKEAAESATQAKARFIAAASHDLRQPLQAAAIYLDLATAEAVDEAQRSDAIERTRRCVRALSDLLNKIMHVSRLDASGVVPERVNIDIERLFQRLHDQYAPAAAAKGIELRIAPGAATVRSDRVLLLQLVDNLVSNAVRYTERGGVLLAARRRGARVALQVWDTGPGISAEDGRAIFDEFRRLGGHGEEANPGMGLGLAIVRRLESILGHRVNLDSRLGRGSRFEVVVPRGDGAEPAAEVVERPTETARGGLVALVDDNAEVLEAVRTVLEVAGHAVIAASSRDGLLSELRRRAVCPDIVLTDYRLGPESTGLDVIAALREEFAPGLPAVVLTGDSSFSMLERKRAEIGFDLLAKPVVTRDLLAVLALQLRGAGG